VLSQEPAKLRKLLLSPSGVLFENESLQIGFRSQMEIPGGLMKIVLYYGNKVASTISVSSVKVTNGAAINNLPIAFTPSSFEVASKQQSQQQCKVAMSAPAAALPALEIAFSVAGGGSFVVRCSLPVVASKFFRPHVFEPQQFKQRWQQLKSEQQQVIPVAHEVDANKLRGAVSGGMSMGLIAGVDTNPNNAIGCCVFHFAKRKPNDANSFVTMPVLLRLEFSPQNHAIRVTVRSPHEATSKSVMAAFVAIFKHTA